eukprot:1282204-Alexandrium_andersonii.AAC.1
MLTRLQRQWLSGVPIDTFGRLGAVKEPALASIDLEVQVSGGLREPLEASTGPAGERSHSPPMGAHGS